MISVDIDIRLLDDLPVPTKDNMGKLSILHEGVFLKKAFAMSTFRMEFNDGKGMTRILIASISCSRHQMLKRASSNEERGSINMFRPSSCPGRLTLKADCGQHPPSRQSSGN